MYFSRQKGFAILSENGRISINARSCIFKVLILWHINFFNRCSSDPYSLETSACPICLQDARPEGSWSRRNQKKAQETKEAQEKKVTQETKEVQTSKAKENKEQEEKEVQEQVEEVIEGKGVEEEQALTDKRTGSQRKKAKKEQ